MAGYRLMTTFASTDIINSIRTSLMWAIGINIFIIGLAFRSWRIGLVSIVPNLLPILGTELYLFLSGAGLQLTSVIALTVAFGIAVDDTIHFLATYMRQRENGVAHTEAVEPDVAAGWPGAGRHNADYLRRYRGCDVFGVAARCVVRDAYGNNADRGADRRSDRAAFTACRRGASF